MARLLDYFQNNQKYLNLTKQIKENNQILIHNVSNAINKALTLLLFQQTKQTVVVVYPNILEATKAYEDFLELTDLNEIGFFCVEEMISSDLITTSANHKLERLKVIYKLLNGIPQLIVTTPDALTHQLMNKVSLEKAILKLKKGTIYQRDTLIKELIKRGYTKTSFVENVGSFSTRGSVIDIYSINTQTPIRIDFFDDEIEEIKTFDITTQRSTSKVDEALIYPFYEIIYDDQEIPNIIGNISKLDTDLETKDKLCFNILNHANIDQMYLYLSLIDSNYQPFYQLLNNPYVLYYSYSSMKEKEQTHIEEVKNYLLQKGIVLENNFFKTTSNFIEVNDKNAFLEPFGAKYNDLETKYIIDCKTSNNIDYQNYLVQMMNEFKLNSKKTYIVTHIDEAKLKLITDLLESNKLAYNKIDSYQQVKVNTINLIIDSDALGFIDYEQNLEVITPNQFAKGKIYHLTKYQKQENTVVAIYNKEDIQVGDYVVHKDYGIGKYLGLKTIENKSVKNDYLVIEYQDNGKLYVPVEKIYVLQKYLGSNNKAPRLTKLNNNEWTKKKQKVKEKLIKIAKDLIETEAKRSLLQGFVYQKDSPMQLEFEQDFAYDETIDQIKAIEEVKKDMESTHPVDRLICGDVGFGKTEVALRASFKAIDNGKQVVMIAPTTVLSRQHYYTFKERFEKYGARVVLLNRFTSYKETKDILEGLKSGYIDILIGTHKALSKDIVYKDLGLLIIDEEQRFGVAQKEAIKKLKANIDVLSLSATPIPRTLQMSLSGIKDMSLIETPPINRKSIQTYILKTNDAVIKEAIYKELARGGQVFYLLNRIDHLDEIVAKVHRLVPEARVGVIHGKMAKDDIEEVLNNFLDHIYDCLVCTTIIETGIDIPNANTLIIEQADHLGLAQLYQIRGRVGRSERVAYAYLMYDSDYLLSDVARKRLDAIKEFTTLGSGYKIAMRDLSIRGAGDILGSEQSGFIDDIGIDLYLEMLNEAVNEQKGLVKEEVSDLPFDLKVSKTVNNNYVDDEAIKIAIHQDISKVFSKEAADNLILEFNDRFGIVSEELKIYIYSKYLETLLKSKGVEKYKVSEKEVELNFDAEHTNKIKYINLLQIANRVAPKWKYEYKMSRIYITIYLSEENSMYAKNSYIYQLIDFMEQI